MKNEPLDKRILGVSKAIEESHEWLAENIVSPGYETCQMLIGNWQAELDQLRMLEEELAELEECNITLDEGIACLYSHPQSADRVSEINSQMATRIANLEPVIRCRAEDLGVDLPADIRFGD